MAFGSPQWMYKSGEAFTLDQSLRFNDDKESRLVRTPTSNGNRRTFTLSVWVKRGNHTLGADQEQDIFGAFYASSGSRYSYIAFDHNDKLKIFGGEYDTSSTPQSFYRITKAVYRDSSAWMHIVWRHDSTDGTAANRDRLYVNGVLSEWDTGLGTDLVTGQNEDSFFNYTTSPMVIGEYASTNTTSTMEFDGYMAEMHWIDGTSVATTSFGETGDYGEWKPIEYAGTYGTNGFHLPFKQDYTVEGFGAVTYRGNDIVQYIGGVGFQPDLVWIKARDGSQSHAWHDSIRGRPYLLTTNSSADDVESAYANSTSDLVSFDTDGFTIGVAHHGRHNTNTQQYIAWCWDMGGAPRLQHTITANGNVQHSTTQEKIGASSIKFDGSGDYLTISDHDDWSSKMVRNWTIEFWYYPSSWVGNAIPISHSDGTNGWWIRQHSSQGVITIYSRKAGSSVVNLDCTTGVSNNAWSHFAITCDSSQNYVVYINGTATATSGTGHGGGFESVGGDLRLGNTNYSAWTGEVNGYLDEIRVSSTVRYTANFTAPTSAFTDDSNTLLLIHSDTSNGSTTFVDSSGNARNTDGTISSYIAANPTYGQSMVSWIGSGSAATVGHGLSSAPEMVIIKNRDRSAQWMVYHEDIGATKFVELSTTAAESTDAAFNNTAPTATVFSIGTGNATNASGEKLMAYCFHSVTGYSKFGTYAGNDTSGNTITTGFPVAWVMIKRRDGINDWNIIDNVRTPTGVSGKKVIRGNDHTTEQTGAETEVELTATGFKLNNTQGEMNGSGRNYIYAAFADKREYAYWLDQSGNNNDWTSDNLTESDIMVDSPTNNFCTWNSLANEPAGVGTLAEGNLKGTTGSAYNGFGSTMHIIPDGKTYIEFTPTAMANNYYVGVLATEQIAVQQKFYNGGPFYGYRTDGLLIYNTSDDPADENNVSTDVDTFGVGDIGQLAIDTTANKIWIGKNNVWQLSGTQNPSAGTGGYSMTAHPAGWQVVFGTGSVNSSNTGVTNFGQDSSFAGNKTAQGNQDGNDIGDFYYTPPTDFLALCTSNLAAVAVTPSKHFNTALYSGNDTARSITGVGFQPDFVWTKNRTGSSKSHNLFDVLRGVNNSLLSDDNGGEVRDQTDLLTAFNTDGFSLGVNAGSQSVNESSRDYVAWNWKAGGSGSSNTAGSINTTATSANTDAGFSISTYTGTGSNATIGHGLSKAPEMVIVKHNTVAGGNNWMVYHHGMASDAETDYMNLNLTDSPSDVATIWNDTAPTATLVSIGTNAAVNDSSVTYVAYCFHSVDGYSKVGSYTGNSNADGTFVYTGFRPAYVLIKRTDSTSSWWIQDTKRDTYNVADAYLVADGTAAEGTYTAIDFLSNGFKARNTSSSFNSGSHIYLAFAETPFKYSNAR